MALCDVYLGDQSWEDYLSNRVLIEGFERSFEKQTMSFDMPLALSAVMEVGLSQSDYQVALESGLGALGTGLSYLGDEADFHLEFGLEKLAGGMDQLNADFHLLLGDIIWKIEMHQDTLNNILQEIRLAEFEREARAFRSRAEKAYLNGWYEEALKDFLDAEKRNYPDFSVLRSIANICLYHLVNLSKALEYFSKAAKYARPSDARQSAEAHYFAAIVCAIQQQFKEGLDHLTHAIELNPKLYEAHYQKACIAAMVDDDKSAVESLEYAIKGDPRYYERARNDKAFDAVRQQVNTLLNQLMEPVQDKIAEVSRDAELLRHYVIAKPEKRQSLSNVFQTVEEQLAAAKSYRAGVQFMDMLSQIQQELRGIYDLFYKQYEMDTRDYARSVAISPDGRLVATGFLYEGIKIWEVDTGIPVHSLRGHASSVNSVAFSPDSQWLASASRDREIKLWDVYTGQEFLTLSGHDGEVNAVTFSPDGQWLASASHDRTVRLWRVITGREVEPFEGHTRAVTSAVFSPDGALLASGSIDKTIRLWDVTTGREVRTLEGHTEGIEALAFSPDGCFLASGGGDKLVKIWDRATGRELQTLRGHVNDVTSVAFSPDGELVAAGSLGQTIRIWRLSTGRVIKTLWFREISWHPVVFSPKGQWLALASRDVQLWLKAILTEEEYAEVKAGEERAMLMKREDEILAFELAELRRREREEAAEEILKAQRRSVGQCEICGTRLSFSRRIVRLPRCKAHKEWRTRLITDGDGLI
jgi:WD40 repeat protein/tetratricopeptide (TPR) repeat protein